MERDAAGPPHHDGGLSPEDREQPVGRVMALASGAQLDRYLTAAPELRSSDDPEQLHAARVALRRGRSVARAARRVAPAEELDLLRAVMGEVAAATSPARDLDVLIGSLPGRCDALPGPLRVGGAAVCDELVRRRVHEQAALVQLLDGPLHHALVRRWQTLANPYRVGGAEPGPDHLRAAGDVVDDRIRAAWRSLRRAGRRALDSGRAGDWHRTRKRAKQVRYLVDAYGGLHGDDAWRRMSKDLRRLQDGLGDLQDLEAGMALLVEVHHGLGPDGALTAGALAAGLANDRAQLLAGVAAAWERFDRPKVQRRFDAALDPVR